MKIFLKVVITLFSIIVILVSVWFFFDSDTKCRFIYGKNICNFYGVMNIISSDPKKSDFEKAMQLCKEMKDVPKKDSCFEYIAQVVSFYDVEKAREACNEIKGFDGIHDKESCCNIIEKPKEERLAESAVVAFMESRIQRNQELALS